MEPRGSGGLTGSRSSGGLYWALLRIRWAKLESRARCDRATEETRRAKARLQPTITEMDRGETRNF